MVFVSNALFWIGGYFKLKLNIPPIIQTCAPLWTEKLNKRRTFKKLREGCRIKGTFLHIGQYDCCIVGEALDLKKRFGDYEMETNTLKYHSFSQQLHYIILEARKNDLESELKWFAEHLQKRHPSIVKRKEHNG